MLREQAFSDRSNYPRVSETATSIDDVEWFAKNKGITNLDDPSTKVETIIDDVNESELARHEAKKAREAKARGEFIDAIFNLDNGTAVLRQKNERAKPAPKSKKSKKSKIAKDIAKVVKRAAKPVKKPAQPAKALTDAQVASKNKRLINKLRRAEMTETLKSGGAIEPIDWRGENLRAHQVQSYDLMMIGKTEGFSVVRVNKIGTRKMQFIVDNFERCNVPEPISCLIKGPDRAKLFDLIGSGKLITVDDIKENVVAGGRTMTYLSRTYNVGIYSVVKSNKTVGWVLAKKVEAGKSDVEAERESEISDLGDMVQAIDYLKIRKEVAARMPDATASDIDDATFIEYKRVQKDGQ